ncbi:hypothetical protein [Labilithrix luteola]|uniref:hypothetical protein n=1 Tax=Labilithrix luteola TaxID=1391654 RepID=UPI0011BAB395|nr:hypothetical protein [Labilithrix luteola]
MAVVSTLAWTRAASAYAWMIRHEYNGCVQCHADPSGGGLLTEYGRAQGVVLLASRYGKDATDEEPGKIKDFAFGLVPLPSPLLLGGDYRLLNFNQHLSVPGAPSTTTSRWIQMQADLEGQLTFGRFRANGSIGYDHNGAQAAAITHRQTDNLISRVHWLGVDLGSDNEFLLRAGRMNLPYGLRIIEHETFVRISTRTDINAAQQDGVAFAWNGEGLRAEIMAILGNYQINPDRFRERGYSGYIEWSPHPKIAAGLSSQVTHVEADPQLAGYPELWRQSHGLFARFTPWKPLVVMAEGDLLVNSTPSSPSSPDRGGPLGHATLLQADVEVWQGLHLIATGETLRPSSHGVDLSYGAWGSVAWFFLPHFDVRGDAIWQHLSTGGPAFTQTLYLAQLHGYL